MAEFKFPVDASQIMLFARAIGDKNPIYADADYARGTEPGGIIAPPTFVQASSQYDPDFPLRPKIGEPWFGSGKTATGLPPKTESAANRPDGGFGASARILHAEQKYLYHQPIRPGDVLTVTTRRGNSWEKEGKRGGSLKFTESITEYRNAAGELVVTAISVGVQTGQVVAQK